MFHLEDKISYGGVSKLGCEMENLDVQKFCSYLNIYYLAVVKVEV